jgi:hypothetical protein
MNQHPGCCQPDHHEQSQPTHTPSEGHGEKSQSNAKIESKSNLNSQYEGTYWNHHYHHQHLQYPYYPHPPYSKYEPPPHYYPHHHYPYPLPLPHHGYYDGTGHAFGPHHSYAPHPPPHYPQQAPTPAAPVQPTPAVVKATIATPEAAAKSSPSQIVLKQNEIPTLTPQNSMDLVYIGLYENVAKPKRFESAGRFIRVWSDNRNHLFYDCICGKRKPIKNLKAMVSHCERHKDDQSSMDSYSCEFCGRKFQHYLGLNSHRRVHKESSAEVPVQPEVFPHLAEVVYSLEPHPEDQVHYASSCSQPPPPPAPPSQPLVISSSMEGVPI